MMNDAVKKQIEKMRSYAESIKTQAECILEDLEDIENDDDLFVIENGFSFIERNGRDGYDAAINTWDLFEEE